MPNGQLLAVAADTNRAHTTIGFPVVQFNTVQKQFVATRKVPIPDDGFPEMPDRYPTLADAFDSCQRRVHSYQGQMHPEPSEIDSTFPDN